jgi:beta-galactosidase
LAGYKLVIVPALNVLTKAQARSLAEYAYAGGYLVLTPRTGMKDEANALLPLRQPGFLREAAGAEVEEYFALLNSVQIQGDINGKANIWAERIKVLDETNTRVLAHYGSGSGWLTGHPAVTVHNYGKGKVCFVGAVLDETSQDALFALILNEAGVESTFVTPQNVEACLRVGTDGREVYILINHSGQEQSVSLPWDAVNHLTDQTGKEIDLKSYGAAVLTKA